MARPARPPGSLALAALLCGLAAGCQEPEEIVLLEVMSEREVSVIEIKAKQYLDETSVRLFTPVRQTIPTDIGQSYVVGQGDEPLKIQVVLPDEGRYAIHIVGYQPGDGPDEEVVCEEDEAPTRLTATLCFDAVGTISLTSVGLGAIPGGPEGIDTDCDTFPEDLETYCADRIASSLSCDQSCNSPAFSALLDCNPPEDFELPGGCEGDIPPDSEWNPFADDSGSLCGDCMDEDCFGGDSSCRDADGDGYPANMDCDDDDPTVNPDAEEVCGNGRDENCTVDIRSCTNGDIPCDVDGDGYLDKVSEGCGDDCDDADPSVHPGAYEGCGADPENPDSCPGCDGIDNNCDGRIDEGCIPEDFDNDGVDFRDDCNDCDPGIRPDFDDACENGFDEDCSGSDATCSADDEDHDGDPSLPAGQDCDDDDPRVYGGAPERCGDGVPQGCSQDPPCSDAPGDEDGDEFLGDVDCDDADASINPWAEEECDEVGVDEDCDGRVNEVLDEDRGCGYRPETSTWEDLDFMTDVEHCGECRHACWPPGNCTREGDECVGGECVCFGEEGCPGDAENYCCPADSQGPAGCRNLSTDVANCGECGYECRPQEECRAGLGSCPDFGGCWCEPFDGPCPPEEHVECCSDGCSNVWTDAENCGSCDSSCPEERTGNRCVGGNCWCNDQICAPPAWCTDVTESDGCGCHDLNSETANCGSCGNRCSAGEVCTGGDCGCPPTTDHCSGAQDDYCCVTVGCRNLNTGESVDAYTVTHCGDCFSTCRVGETCSDGECVCTGSCSDGDPCTEDRCEGGHCEHYTLDNDNDGYCAPGCSDEGRGDCDDSPADCNDSNENINPGEAERCSTGADDDCDGDTNDLNANGCTTYYRDADNDDYGRSASECRCAPQGEYDVTNDDDCNDNNGAINPGADEVCDGVDNDCNSSADGSDECAGYCCGIPPGCRACCANGQCPGATDHCDIGGSYTCVCDGGWTDCAGDCDCNTGGAYCCDGTTCRSTAGDACCTNAQCELAHDHCDTSADLCVCDDDWTDCASDCDCNTGDGAYCCDSGACRSTAGDACCTDAQCEATHDHCNTSTDVCVCDDDWTDCAGDCDCNTGGGAYCCDSGTCRSTAGDACCTDAQCELTHDHCNTTTDVCVCDTGWEDCASDCDCNTGGNYCCSSSTCIDRSGSGTGTGCCAPADCGSGGGWTCSGNTCSCGGLDCGSACYSSGTCCDDDDPACSTNANPDCNSSSHTCYCRAASRACTGSESHCCTDGCCTHACNGSGGSCGT